MARHLLLICIVVAFSSLVRGQKECGIEVLDLSGVWQFSLDPRDDGKREDRWLPICPWLRLKS